GRTVNFRTQIGAFLWRCRILCREKPSWRYRLFGLYLRPKVGTMLFLVQKPGRIVVVERTTNSTTCCNTVADCFDFVSAKLFAISDWVRFRNHQSQNGSNCVAQ